MRLRVGDVVRLFDGCGHEWEGTVDAIDRDRVAVRLGRALPAAPEASVRLTLVQALLKGDAMDGVIRDAVMLGVYAIVPLLTARIETDRRANVAASRMERWTRVAVASAKQCGRAVVPRILPPTTFLDALSLPAPAARVALVEPTAEWPPLPLEHLRLNGVPATAEVWIGPEGGWTPEEVLRMSQASLVPVTLGGRTLRAESAAIVGLTALHCTWGEFA